MTDQFQHVMVLTSIIIGLGITHILGGIGAAIDRLTGHGKRLRLSWAHGAWVAFVFLWMVLFWWWEFRLIELPVWTLAHYFFIVVYAVLLFLLAVILIPRDWTVVDDLNEYFVSKRRWFYAVLIVADLADPVDSFFKGGWEYIAATGVFAIAFTVVSIPASIVGFCSRSIRVHTVIAILCLLCQIIVGFQVFPRLGFAIQ